MKELLDLTVDAHGGLERWNSYRTVALELSVGGALWSLKGHAGLFTNATYEADLHKQRARLWSWMARSDGWRKPVLRCAA